MHICLYWILRVAVWFESYVLLNLWDRRNSAEAFVWTNSFGNLTESSIHCKQTQNPSEQRFLKKKSVFFLFIELQRKHWMVKNKGILVVQACRGNSPGYFSVARLWLLTAIPCIARRRIEWLCDSNHIKWDNKRRMRYMEITVTGPSSERRDTRVHIKKGKKKRA